MSYWIGLVEPDIKHKGIEDFGVHCSWNFREMMSHLPCDWVRKWQGKQAKDMYKKLEDSIDELTVHAPLYRKYVIDPHRNLGTIDNCLKILELCYEGFRTYPSAIIVVN